MSTFGGLGIAYSGLTAARAALDVAGHNITNADTDGYTRQRLDTAAVGAPASTGRVAGGPLSSGQGVSVVDISRLSDAVLDSGVRTASAANGYAQVRSDSLDALQTGFNEPGDNGLSARLQGFWSSWQDLSNHPDDASTGSVVLQDASSLVAGIAAGYTAATTAWTNARSQVDGLADRLNSDADQVAALNASIRKTLAAGGNVNDLLDQRANLTADIASIAGGTVTGNKDGTVNVFIGGNVLVSGSDADHVAVTGSTSMDGAEAAPVAVEWAQHPGVAVGVDGGTLAGALSLLAPANEDGTGGVIAQTAASYNALATQLATQVNAIHSAAQTVDGRSGLDFFSVSATGPAALGLSVVPTSTSDIAVAAAGAGALDGSAADAISRIGQAAGSPDSIWSATVTTVGSAAQTAISQASLSSTALTNAQTMQASAESVDLDEENMNMLQAQTSYQAAARMMTAVDSILDTLINRTGLVGISG